MNRGEIIEHVRTALSSVLNQDTDITDEHLRLFDDLGLDSTSVLELLMALEDTIDFAIDPDELSPDVFRTVQSLIDYVQECLTEPDRTAAVGTAATHGPV